VPELRSRTEKQNYFQWSFLNSPTVPLSKKKGKGGGEMKGIAERILVLGVLAAVLAAGTYAVAAKMEINGVQQLGSGSASVSSPAGVDNVQWVLLPNDPSLVDKVTLSFNAELAAGSTIYVQLLTSMDGSTVVIASGSTTLESDLPDSEEVTIDVTNASAEAIDGIRVTVVAPPPS
jgi:hypothetical protein